MTETLDIVLAQINPSVGDVEGNSSLIKGVRAEAGEADLVVVGELAVCGYPPEDLVLKAAFLDAVEESVRTLAAVTGDGGPALLMGAPWRRDGKLHNAALLLEGGDIAAVRLKHHLPNYGVFDEKRLFAPGALPGPVPFRGARLGLMICEDMWEPDVTECLQESGADILVVLNGSPFGVNKADERLNHAVARVVESGLPLIYVNLVGGQDELVFDGASFVLGADRRLGAQAASWETGILPTRWRRSEGWTCDAGAVSEAPGEMESIWRAMTTGLRDYVDKNGFPGVLIGLSGGIDSALSAAVAVDALGADRVRCVMMPSPYTSGESIEDASEVARLLGVDLRTIAIDPAMGVFTEMLGEAFTDTVADETEENIQARLRGIILMALSNKFGDMVLSTGNKSEMSVGYATLYGDMCGGFSVLKDVYKTTVFDLARWRNGSACPVMGERVITKPPSAELKPDQTDQDSLPPYDELDAILGLLIEGDLAPDAVVEKGHDGAIVARVWRLLERAEYKRRQAPPGVKITHRAFGRDRRYPITNGFTGP
jgi:NAD+ synthase